MSPDLVDHRFWLTAERAVNEDYIDYLRARVKILAQSVRSRSRIRSQIWTRPEEGCEVWAIEPGPLAGRVVLEKPVEGLARSFYVGPHFRKGEDGDIVVVSWAAPVAQLFYGGSGDSVATESNVLARRTFVPIGEDIEDFVDEGEPAAFKLSETARPDIPSPPDSVGTMAPNLGASEVGAKQTSGANDDATRMTWLDEDSCVPANTFDQPASVEAPSGLEDSHRLSEVVEASERSGSLETADTFTLRAKDAVLAVLERPRTGRLSPVLATMQRDQYELVTWPDDVPLIVEGPPGTGKTVIAVHRAAYLADEERRGGAIGKVLLVGPTKQYVYQVSESLGRLTTGDVRVTSLNDLLATLAGLRKSPADERGDHDDWIATSKLLSSLIDRTAGALRREGRFGRTPTLDRKVVFEELRSRSQLVRSLCEDEDLWSWLGDLESLTVAETLTRRLPLLAYIGVTASATSAVRYDHVVVDEGQDIRPLEWRVLLDRLHFPDRVTILGDLNQRRSDFTSSSWEALISDLGLDVGGREPVVRTITTGYRTTRPILEFASQLLPRDQRTVSALRDGPAPQVVRVANDAIVRTTVQYAIDLARSFPSGQIAVITLKPTEMNDAFRKKGWTRPPISDGWTSDGLTVLVLKPNRARGLEFDGVVVVEPSVFPMNFGRYGALYTSLTRAVRELVVVHSQPLPLALKNRKQRNLS